ncbi:PQQ-dependent sugar dehydrogenase [Microvirga roseola]|uniref:PQQ-dependent sugar dehydrogenase n=1 Tax=Microvirga roseola TaxID=2883126 RepID=UPI001E28FF4D|nr:PQQ-dependent sugar dehydrogenase [Microvirga roseola]
MRQLVNWVSSAAILAFLGSVSGALTLDTLEPTLTPGVEEAANDLVPVRIAGPFEFPWSVGFLPDGAFLVTEKPGGSGSSFPTGRCNRSEDFPRSERVTRVVCLTWR